jgi:hypothetical protein
MDTAATQHPPHIPPMERDVAVGEQSWDVQRSCPPELVELWELVASAPVPVDMPVVVSPGLKQDQKDYGLSDWEV